MPPATTECTVVNITDDNIREGNETFSVVISSPDNPVILRASTAVITIKDDDGKDIALVTMAIFQGVPY